MTENIYVNKFLEKALATSTLIFAYTGCAYACGSNEYEVCAGLCWCQPNSGTLFPDPRKDISDAATALAKGDNKLFNRAVGKIMLKSPNCIGCNALVESTFENEGKEFVQETVGKGFLILAGKSTGYASWLVVSDDKRGLAYKVPINSPSTPQTPPPDPSRPRGFFYISDATCIVKSGRYVIAGWAAPFKVYDKRDGNKPTEWPKVDLVQGDIIVLNTVNSCKQTKYLNQNATQRVRLVYKGNSTSPTVKATQMTYFITGQVDNAKELPITKFTGDGINVSNSIMANGKTVSRGFLQADGKKLTVNVPNRAKGFWTYVGYSNCPLAAHNAGVPHGIKASLLIDSKEVDSTPLTYDDKNEGFLYVDIPSKIKKLTLQNVVTNGRWCGNILWDSPTFLVN